MGSCTSTQSSHVATAKLILQDGRLQEFSYPIKASYVLAKNPACFICNSDEMDFDDVVSAVNGDEDLQPGQLYFALPITWLNRPMQAAEMAALAVKASAALMKSSNCHEKCGCRNTPVAPGKLSRSKSLPKSISGGRDSRRRRNVGGGLSSGQIKFTALLNAIPE